MGNVLRLVLEGGADSHVQYNSGQTLLHIASRSGNIEVVQRLLTLSVDVNLHDNRGQTPLHVARQSSEGILLLLLDHGDPNVQNDEGQTPLHFASRSGRIKVAQRLLEFGAYVNSRDNRGRYTNLRDKGVRRI